MGIDSCVHIPMDCEDTKKRNMPREAQQGSNYGREVREAQQGSNHGREVLAC